MVFSAIHQCKPVIIIYIVKLKSLSSRVCSLQPHGLYSPWNSPGQKTGTGAFPFSSGSSQARDQTQISHIAGRFFTIWNTKIFQEYWNRYPIPSPGDLPELWIKQGSPALQVDSLPAELTGEPKRPRLHSEMPFPISLPGFKSSSVSLARFESHILAPAPKWEGNGMTCV